MLFVPNATEESYIREILARDETAVVVEDGEGVEILAVANYPKACREYYVGRLVQAVFRTQYDLDARMALAKAKAG